ncbi:MAG: hypothetical protein ACLPH3_24300 [Terracidiphilus sp.]
MGHCWQGVQHPCGRQIHPDLATSGGILQTGLGVTLNDDEVKRHLKPGTGYFEPTPMWDEAHSWDDALFN